MEPGAGIPLLDARRRLRVQAQELRSSILSCTRCPLHSHSPSPPVPFRGPVPAKITVLGMAPGKDEVRANQPFVGPAGMEMERALRKCGFNVREIAFCNTVQCQPMDGPGINTNREPSIIEHAACLEWKLAQIFLFQSPYLIIVGKVALEGLRPDLRNSLGSLQSHALHWEQGMKMNGSPVPFRIQAMVTYHPSAAIRNPPRYRPLLEAALTKLRHEMSEGYLGVGERCVVCGRDVELYDENGAAWCEGHWERRGITQGRLEV